MDFVQKLGLNKKMLTKEGFCAKLKVGLGAEIELNLEATSGFEPLNRGFADPRLATWLRRRVNLRVAEPPPPSCDI